MNIPLNGRIAIVDDQINQALPLMNLFSKLQVPYIYYDSDIRNLPEADSAYNDIRILFLDINLIDNSVKDDKELKAKLIPTLNRVLSKDNYPYLLIYWSRNETEHKKLVKEIFENDLKSKSPIAYLSLRKSDYFNLDGSETTLYEEKLPELIKRIEKSINSYPIYKYLISWENQIHLAADNTLEDVFKLDKKGKEWDQYSKFLFYKLAQSYAGKTLRDSSPEEQIKSAYYSLGFIFNDSLEYSISNSTSTTTPEALLEIVHDNSESLNVLNKKILFSNDYKDKYTPGVVFELESDAANKKHDYGNVLNNWISRDVYIKDIEKTITSELKGKTGNIRKREKEKIIKKKVKELKEKIKVDLKNIEVNVTPICDYVQGKSLYYRLIPGLLVNSKYSKYINKTSEAIYVSPNFKLSSTDTDSFFLLLDFRIFTSVSKDKIDELMQPKFRIRQLLLSEIQSKLARHINRQGILFLTD